MSAKLFSFFPHFSVFTTFSSHILSNLAHSILFFFRFLKLLFSFFFAFFGAAFSFFGSTFSFSVWAFSFYLFYYYFDQAPLSPVKHLSTHTGPRITNLGCPAPYLRRHRAKNTSDGKKKTIARGKAALRDWSRNGEKTRIRNPRSVRDAWSVEGSGP